MAALIESAVAEEVAKYLKTRRAASIEEISAVLVLDEQTVRTALKSLEDEGYVDVRASKLDEDQIAVSTNVLLRTTL